MSTLFSEDDVIISKRDNYATEMNIREISKYMDRGNLFCVASGKDFIKIGNPTSLSKLQYNYIVSSNGLAAFDYGLNPIYVNSLDKESLEKYLEIIKSCKLIKSYELKDMYGLPARDTSKAVQIVCQKDQTSLIDKRDLVNQIDLEYLDNNEFIYFNNPTDLVDGIEAIRADRGIDKDSVYTIGDDIYALQMLTNYNGYRTSEDCTILKMCGVPKIKNVRKLIRRIKRK